MVARNDRRDRPLEEDPEYKGFLDAALGKLWRADENTEDVWFWVVCFAASVLAAYPPLAARDALQSVYALRAVVCTAVVIALSVRLQFHSRKGVRA